MDRRTFLKATGVASMGGMVGLAGCTAPTEGDEETTGGGGTTSGGATGTSGDAGTTGGGGGGPSAPNTVQMVTEGSQFYFDPVGLFVEPGETITWRIESGSHSSTAYAASLDSADTTRIPQDAEPWDSGILAQQGATFDYTFEVQGTYDYFCIPHETLGMVARIVCGEPSSGERSPPPAGKLPSEQAIMEQGAISHAEFSGGSSGG